MSIYTKELMGLITKYAALTNENKFSISNRVKKHFVKAKINNIVNKIAQNQANLIFKQTVELYKEIINSNIK